MRDLANIARDPWERPKGIAAGIENHAAVIFCKVADLLFPGSVITGKFMNKNDRDALTRFFVIHLDPVVCRQMRHDFLVQKAWARAESPASIVMTDPLV